MKTPAPPSSSLQASLHLKLGFGHFHNSSHTVPLAQAAQFFVVFLGLVDQQSHCFSVKVDFSL